LHNYSEQNTIDGKRANWALLNSALIADVDMQAQFGRCSDAAGACCRVSSEKVLSKLRCPLSAEQIDTLCQWSSNETLIEFLSILKLKVRAPVKIHVILLRCK
jgi:hypothetical protein